MSRRLFLSLLLLLAASASAEDARELVRRAVERDFINWERLRNYTFVENLEAKVSVGWGVRVGSGVKLDVLILYGEPFHRVLERNGRPLSDEEQYRQQVALDRFAALRAVETPAQRRQRLQNEFDKHIAESAYLREIPDAFDFSIAGQKTIAGRRVLVIQAEPRPGYEPKDERARLFTALRVRIWIDPESDSWVKFQAEVIGDTEQSLRINSAAIDATIANIREGTRFEFEQQRLNDEVWAPKRSYVRLVGRRANRNTTVEQTQTESNYRRFRAETQIVPVP